MSGIADISIAKRSSGVIMFAGMADRRAVISALVPDFKPHEAAAFIRQSFFKAELSGAVSAQLHELMAMQFDATRVWGELSGRLCCRQDRLIFEPVPSPADTRIYKAFCAFRAQAAAEAAWVLLGEVRAYRSMLQNSCSAAWEARLDGLEAGLSACASRQCKDAAGLDLGSLEQVLGSVTRLCLADLGAAERGFCGAFHFHPNGEPPNCADFRQTTVWGVPMLVIAAKPAPRSLNGVYLLFAEQFERLL